tara:strand:- start:2098 stop:2409 length:312 start_codon:yes stop_codon:yes gene_type:complete
MKEIYKGFALAKFRYGFEQLWEQNSLTDNAVADLQKQVLQLPNVDETVVIDTRNRLMESYQKNKFLEYMTGEEIFLSQVGIEPEKPVETLRMPYGVHLFLVLK